MSDEKVYTTEQVAERLQVHVETVRDWLISGKLKGTKVAGWLWRVKEEDLEEFINGTSKANCQTS